ncbi:MAG: CHAD domain-containing protein [Anaerolineaceae bacterium]|nr:CHAD domain-containing protein [Anaerolineaceae bacterium]
MDNQEKTIIRSYISDLFNNQVSYLENQVEGIVYDGDIEFLHHTRVMSRRIRNSISVFSPYIGKKKSKKWFVSLKKLTKSLTRVRDLDVQINFLESELEKITEQKYLTGLQRLLLRKQQKRAKKQNNVREAILKFEKEKTISGIHDFIENHPFDPENFSSPDTLRHIGLDEIDKLTKICFSFVPFITSPDQIEALHSLRIAIKNLRYTTELFLPLFPNLDAYISILKKFQDDLGEIHDCDVWVLDLETFMEEEKQRISDFYGQSGPFNFIKPGIIFLIEDIKNRKINVHEKFITRWNEQFQNQFWSNLRLIFDNDQNRTLIEIS